MATYITYILGGLNPNILIMTSNDVSINIQTAISLAITGGIIWYGKEVVTKITSLIGSKQDTIIEADTSTTTETK